MLRAAVLGVLVQVVLQAGFAEAICCDDIRSDIENRTNAFNVLCTKNDPHLEECCRAMEQDLRKHKLAYRTLCPNHEVDYCKSSPCHSNATCVSHSDSFSCKCNAGFTGSGLECTAVVRSCADLYISGVRQNGVYTIEPDDLGPFQVRCDMTKDGGGWTVFQRRQDGSENFYRGWADYKAGFGNLSGEFWLGLDKIHRLSKSGQNILRVDLMDFNGAQRYAEYGNFSVADESDKYRLNVGNYSGDAGDSLAYHNRMKFSTKDSDNDVVSDNCAVRWRGSWWYKSCHVSNLNGLYLGVGQTSSTGIQWQGWHYQSMKKTEMKVRPSQF